MKFLSRQVLFDKMLILMTIEDSKVTLLRRGDKEKIKPITLNLDVMRETVLKLFTHAIIHVVSNKKHF